MAGHTIILRGEPQRELARSMILRAPDNYVVTISEQKRSNEQNDKMWAMLTDISRAKPEGICEIPDMWKNLMMRACGHDAQFMNGLDGKPFPVGFRTSKLKVSEMRDLITFIQEYGDRHGVEWSEPNPYEREDAA